MTVPNVEISNVFISLADRGDPAEPSAALRHCADDFLASPIDNLGHRGIAAGDVVRSAETLAALVPDITAATTADAYPDDDLSRLMAANHRAYLRHRPLSPLLLPNRPRLEELPWVRAVQRHRSDQALGAHAALRRLGELVLDAFADTPMPNTLVRELALLSSEAGEEPPWVEEPAADIFTGPFPAVFRTAALTAARLLTGTLYERYYDIDYAWLSRLDAERIPPHHTYAQSWFDRLCRTRAGVEPDARGRDANGLIIEQAQILTTHNLATLVHTLRARPAAGWDRLAHQAFETVVTLTGRLPGNPAPRPAIRRIGSAWRHMLFFLSVPGAGDPAVFADGRLRRLTVERPCVRDRLLPALTGLAHIAAGGVFAADGTAAEGRRLLGWTADATHWLS